MILTSGKAEGVREVMDLRWVGDEARMESTHDPPLMSRSWRRCFSHIGMLGMVMYFPETEESFWDNIVEFEFLGSVMGAIVCLVIFADGAELFVCVRNRREKNERDGRWERRWRLGVIYRHQLSTLVELRKDIIFGLAKKKKRKRRWAQFQKSWRVHVIPNTARAQKSSAVFAVTGTAVGQM